MKALDPETSETYMFIGCEQEEEKKQIKRKSQKECHWRNGGAGKNGKFDTVRTI